MASPRAREAGVLLVQVLVLLAFLQGTSCDREDLTEGPKLAQAVPKEPDDSGPPVNPPPPPAASLRGKLFINEVVADNQTGLQDESGKFSPWIELYNNTDEPINLGGMGLSDDLTKPEKWTLPYSQETILAPRGFIVIFADGDTADATDLHASFILSAKPLNLIINKGSDLFFFFDASALETDVAVGRLPDGSSTIAVLGAPTPGAANKAGTPLVPPEASFIRGDATGDGRVNILDMTFVLAVLFASEPIPRCEDSMDADDDGRVDMTDAFYIGAALFLQGPSFPPPYPVPATDPTRDTLPCPAE